MKSKPSTEQQASDLSMSERESRASDERPGSLFWWAVTPDLVRNWMPPLQREPQLAATARPALTRTAAQALGPSISLAEKSVREAVRLAVHAAESAGDPDYPLCIKPLPQDDRFRGEAWQRWPFKLLYQSFLLNQQWWHSTTTGIRGVSAHMNRSSPSLRGNF